MQRATYKPSHDVLESELYNPGQKRTPMTTDVAYLASDCTPATRRACPTLCQHQGHDLACQRASNCHGYLIFEYRAASNAVRNHAWVQFDAGVALDTPWFRTVWPAVARGAAKRGRVSAPAQRAKQRLEKAPCVQLTVGAWLAVCSLKRLRTAYMRLLSQGTVEIQTDCP